MKLNRTDRKALESLSSIGCEVCFSAGGEASSTSHCHSISARYYKEAHEFGDCVIAGFQRVLKGMSALEVPELCFENEGTLKLTDSSNTGVELCVEGICLDKEEQPVLPEIHPSAIRFLVNASVVERIKPHVVIPEHYLTKGASITLTTLGSAEEWSKMQANHTMLNSATLKLTVAKVKKMDRHVLYFGDNHLKK